jgi:hypothetical protein
MTLPVALYDAKGFTVSPDNRSVYYRRDSAESDIWLRAVEWLRSKSKVAREALSGRPCQPSRSSKIRFRRHD